MENTLKNELEPVTRELILSKLEEIRATIETKEKTDKSISTIDELTKKDYNITKDAKPLGGMDLTITDNNLTRQKNILYEDWMVIKYLNNEVILDQQSIKDIDNFIAKSKNKYKNHEIIYLPCLNNIIIKLCINT